MTPLPPTSPRATGPQHWPLGQTRGDVAAEPTGAGAALEQALAINTATSDDELLARTVEAAGRLTGATVACAVDRRGAVATWGDAELAARLSTAVPRSPRLYGPRATGAAYPDLGLLDALAAGLAGSHVVVVASTEPDRFGPEARRLLALVVAHATAGRERLRELAALAHLAESDPLTGLRHYRPFEERLASSQPERTAVIAIDIDNFKLINDVHGHQAGDDALVALVAALRRALRGDDHIYRIGGDEFAVVIDVTAPAEVSAISRRLLRAARGAGYPISVGAALRAPEETGRETLLRADRALYQAKRAGRNTARLAA
jgi:diguanylate cyclase (GGDEF)-like protein